MLTTLAGVLGFPAAHSRSPAMMNAAFAELGLDWRYLRLPVAPDLFPAVAKERPIIASVIYNRLRDDLRLDIDATVRFVTGNWTRPLRVSELENPSPYNTRVHAGLPPGPIGSPGLDSIKAAARPARTDYLFYVAAVCGNGRHKFAATDAQHQRNVAEYEQARAERGGKSPTDC